MINVSDKAIKTLNTAKCFVAFVEAVDNTIAPPVEINALTVVAHIARTVLEV